MMFALLLTGFQAIQHPLLCTEPLTCQQWATIANEFIELGQDESEKQIIALSKTKDNFRANERCSHLLRLLYTPKPNSELRAPMLGGPGGVPYLSMKGKNWPEMPFVYQDGVILLTARGYIVAGLPEPAQLYAEYLREEGVWKSTQFPIPSAKEANQAIDNLIKSDRWKALKWDEKTDYLEYHMSPDRMVEYFRQQAGK